VYKKKGREQSHHYPQTLLEGPAFLYFLIVAPTPLATQLKSKAGKGLTPFLPLLFTCKIVFLQVKSI
jgi:hypothetical protein